MFQGKGIKQLVSKTLLWGLRVLYLIILTSASNLVLQKRQSVRRTLRWLAGSGASGLFIYQRLLKTFF